MVSEPDGDVGGEPVGDGAVLEAELVQAAKSSSRHRPPEARAPAPLSEAPLGRGSPCEPSGRDLAEVPSGRGSPCEPSGRDLAEAPSGGVSPCEPAGRDPN